MCTILKFAPAAETGAQRESCGQAKTAEVVIFPGVRYERNGKADTVELTGNRQQRDYLVL